MDYERVNIKNEDELYANFKRQLEKLNAKELKRFGRDTLTKEVHWQNWKDFRIESNPKLMQIYIVLE